MNSKSKSSRHELEQKQNGASGGLLLAVYMDCMSGPEGQVLAPQAWPWTNPLILPTCAMQSHRRGVRVGAADQTAWSWIPASHYTAEWPPPPAKVSYSMALCLSYLIYPMWMIIKPMSLYDAWHITLGTIIISSSSSSNSSTRSSNSSTSSSSSNSSTSSSNSSSSSSNSSSSSSNSSSSSSIILKVALLLTLLFLLMISKVLSTTDYLWYMKYLFIYFDKRICQVGQVIKWLPWEGEGRPPFVVWPLLRPWPTLSTNILL